MNLEALFGGTFTRERLVLVLDIGSASVRGALVGIAGDKPPIILYTVEKDFKMKEHVDPHALTWSMETEVGEVLSEIEKKGLPHLRYTNYYGVLPRTVFCVLWAPWHISQVRKVTYSRKAPFQVDEKFLSDLLEKEVIDFQRTESKRLQREGVTEDRIELIEKETIQIKLNGYEVRSPFGKEAQELQMRLYLSMVPHEIIKKIRKRILSVFRYKEIFFRSSTLSSFTTVRDIWANKKDFLLVDVSGELTEITLVKEGSMFETASYPMGKNFFVREIAKNLHTSPEEALSLLNVYVLEKGNKALEGRLDTVLVKLKHEWLSRFIRTLHEVGEGSTLPTQIFLTAPRTIGAWLTRILAKDNELQEAYAVTKPFYVNLLGDNIFSHFVHIGNDVTGDPFLSTDALFAQKLYYPKQ